MSRYTFVDWLRLKYLTFFSRLTHNSTVEAVIAAILKFALEKSISYTHAMQNPQPLLDNPG